MQCYPNSNDVNEIIIIFKMNNNIIFMVRCQQYYQEKSEKVRRLY